MVFEYVMASCHSKDDYLITKSARKANFMANHYFHICPTAIS